MLEAHNYFYQRVRLIIQPMKLFDYYVHVHLKLFSDSKLNFCDFESILSDPLTYIQIIFNKILSTRQGQNICLNIKT